MYAPLPTALKPAKVLFLSRAEGSVRMDVKILRTVGTSTFTHMTDTASALAHLLREKQRLAELAKLSSRRDHANPVDLVVCDEHLADGPVSAFLYALAGNQALVSQPVLVLASTGKTAKALREAGIYVLERPYSGSDLERMAQTAMSPMRRTLRLEELEKVFGKPVKREKTAEKAPEDKLPTTAAGWLDRGVAMLKSENPFEAERAFQEVLNRQHDNLEAALGMVRAKRANGDEKGVERYLLKAATCLKRMGDTKRYAAVMEKLPERVRENPFAHEALALMNEDCFEPAAKTFLEAAQHAGTVPLHRIVSRSCLMTKSPDTCVHRLCTAFEAMGNNVTASKLRSRLLTYDPNYRAGEYSWMDAFPRIKEIVSVMRYTTWVWRRV